jgi:hypothetical protein
MYDIQTVTGRIIELRRFMNRRPHITEHDPSRERWEMWLAAADGSEHKYVVYSRSMPARVGHALHLVHIDGTPVGLYNLETGIRENFTRADPALLLRRFDSAVWAAGVFVGMAFLLTGQLIAFMAVIALVLLYFPFIVLVRYVSRKSLQSQVDAVLDEIQSDNVIRPFRRRQ